MIHESKELRERLYEIDHSSGLKIFVMPKANYKSTYAVLGTQYGSIDTCFKRSDQKDSYPGCYDISSAGHIPAGVDFIPSALRELREELGVEAKAEQLHFCGQRQFSFKAVFHDRDFWDNQVSNVYLLWLDREEDTFSLQKEEVSEVKWFDFEDCWHGVQENTLPNCIRMDELLMVKKGAEETCDLVG